MYLFYGNKIIKIFDLPTLEILAIFVVFMVIHFFNKIIIISYLDSRQSDLTSTP